MADQLTFDDLKDTLKKFKCAPPTGHGSTHLELEVDVNWVQGDITIVKVTTKNVVEKPKYKD